MDYDGTRNLLSQALDRGRDAIRNLGFMNLPPRRSVDKVCGEIDAAILRLRRAIEVLEDAKSQARADNPPKLKVVE